MSMLIEQTVLLRTENCSVTFSLAESTRPYKDKWCYRCECGKYETRSFIGKKDQDAIPQGILVSMELHAEKHNVQPAAAKA